MTTRVVKAVDRADQPTEMSPNSAVCIWRHDYSGPYAQIQINWQPHRKHRFAEALITMQET